MKKYLILLTSMFTITVATFAQKGLNFGVYNQPGMSMGGVVQLQSVINSGTTTYVKMNKSFTFGFDFGGEIGYNFNDNYGISIGTSFSHQGQHYNYSYPAADSMKLQFTTSLNYFKIPIQFNYNKSISNSIYFYCSAGVYYSSLMGYKNVETYTYTAAPGGTDVETASGKSFTVAQTDPSGTISENYSLSSAPFKSYDFGGILAAGFQFKLSKYIYFPITLNYQFGFRNVKSELSIINNLGGGNVPYWGDSDNPNLTLKYHNSSLELKIGIKFFVSRNL